MIPRLCALHFLCERCRADNEDGQRARDNLRTKAFKGQDIGPRFTCPHGRGEVGAFIPWPESRGIGDTVKRITEVIGIQQCEPCKKRQERWNEAVPYQIDRPA